MNVKQWKDVSKGKPAFTLKGHEQPLFDISAKGELRMRYLPLLPESEVPRFVRWLAEVYEMQTIFEKEITELEDLGWGEQKEGKKCQ